MDIAAPPSFALYVAVNLGRLPTKCVVYTRPHDSINRCFFVQHAHLPAWHFCCSSIQKVLCSHIRRELTWMVINGQTAEDTPPLKGSALQHCRGPGLQCLRQLRRVRWNGCSNWKVVKATEVTEEAVLDCVMPCAATGQPAPRAAGIRPAASPSPCWLSPRSSMAAADRARKRADAAVAPECKAPGAPAGGGGIQQPHQVRCWELPPRWPHSSQLMLGSKIGGGRGRPGSQ